MPPAPPRRTREQRYALLATFVTLGFGLLLAGLVRLQVAQHDELAKLADQNRIRLDVMRAPRGAIFDRRGRLLADNTPSFDIVFRPMPAESVSRARTVVASDWVWRVTSLIEGDSDQVRRLVREANRSGQTAVLRRSAPYPVMAAVEEMRSELPGLDVDVSPIRYYPEGSLAAQLLGYAGQVNERELAERAENGYRLGDLIGKNGLERRYEDLLRGQDGAEFVVVNAMGKRVARLQGEPPRAPVPGHDLTLAIDLDVQRALEEAMSTIPRGAAVAIDPRDGGILAMVSRPNFDPNEFSRGISFARWDEINAGGAYPLLNRAIQSAYPPGSTFKVVTTVSGEEAGLVDGHTHMAVACAGGYRFGGRWFGCWDKRGHGSLDLGAALAQSCDTYFYQLGLELGLDRLQASARELGLGDRTGIDLPAESPGLVPTTAYYDRHFGKSRWPRGVILNLSIGQGEMLATPLQLALMTAIVANHGRPVRPHVVRAAEGSRSFRIDKPVESGVALNDVQWQTLHDAMQRAVEAGTAGRARLPGIAVAGKTGTAQNPHGQDHALFVCFAPVEAPRIAIAIVAENSGHGGSIAAPIAAHAMRVLFARDSLLASEPPVPRARFLPALPDSEEFLGD